MKSQCLLLLVLLVTALAAAGCGGSAQPPPAAPPTEAPEAPQAPGPSQESAVTVVDNSFQGSAITVPAGTTVVWTHDGGNPHTVTADDGSFDSGTLSNGGTFTVTFDQAGTFAYYCRFHGGPGGAGMSGVITVTE
ncbi:MAG: plastocyanin/azurin family copper-binding protein [Anaerolineae bacterium]